MSFGAVGGAIAGQVVGGMFGGDEEGGSSGETFKYGTKDTTIAEDETTKKYLKISDVAIDKIVADILGGEKGIADIFSKENVAGIYDSTVAAQASGDLVANLAGEIAKLRAVAIEERKLDSEENIVIDESTKTEDEDYTDDLFDFAGAQAGGKIGAEYGEAAGIAINDFFS